MAESRQTVAETLAGVCARRPILSPLVLVFQPLLEAQALLPAQLEPLLAATKPSLTWQAERGQQGVPLLAGANLHGLGAALRQSATTLLPLLQAHQSIQAHMPAAAAFFLPQSENAAASTAAEALLAGDEKSLSVLAHKANVPPSLFVFVLETILTPVLRAVVHSTENHAWNRENAWHEGYCPVCGAFPTFAWLDKAIFDEKNAFLAGGGGKKHLHCGQCGAEWHFRRGACPACGEEGSGIIELLKEAKDAQGERIDWCTKCKSYCPVVDLREREGFPNPDAMALGMMHLDLVAAEKKLHPLKASFWNQF